ncbi:MAG TPA: hypothetical protein PKC42_03695, partial [Candidatus Nanoperiomorbaceae bacterium]|nr:hypothetical protein [Candidatus Nanoperiomorbaceae bacterium]
ARYQRGVRAAAGEGGQGRPACRGVGGERADRKILQQIFTPPSMRVRARRFTRREHTMVSGWASRVLPQGTFTP